MRRARELRTKIILRDLRSTQYGWYSVVEKVQLHVGEKNMILHACDMCEEACMIKSGFNVVVNLRWLAGEGN